MRRQRRRVIFASCLVVTTGALALSACATGGDGDGIEIVSDGDGPTVLQGIRVQDFKESGSTPLKSRFTFSLGPDYEGQAPTRYRLYRQKEGGEVLPMHTTQPSQTAHVGVLEDGTLLPMFGFTYHYTVVAEYEIDGVEYVTEPSDTVTVQPSVPRQHDRDPAIARDLSINFILFTYPDLPVPWTKEYLETLAFDDNDGARSLRNYLWELTTGYAATPQAARLRAVQLTGQVIDWEDLPSTSSDYAGLSVLVDEVRSSGRLDDLKQLYPADFYIVVFNTGAGGGVSRGGNEVWVGANAINDVARFATAVHELGHRWGLGHSSALYCDGNVLPADLYDLTACNRSVYGDMTNPMSGLESTTHFSGYHKAALGLFNGRSEFAELQPGTVREYDLFDSTTITATRDIQLLVLSLDAYDSALVVEYRRPLGFNAHMVTLGHSEIAAPRAVHVYYRPGKYVVGGATADIWIPYTTRFHRELIVATPEKDVYDPHRGIRVEVVNDGDYKVEVRITREAT